LALPFTLYRPASALCRRSAAALWLQYRAMQRVMRETRSNNRQNIPTPGSIRAPMSGF